jgi:hypothetical protein
MGPDSATPCWAVVTGASAVRPARKACTERSVISPVVCATAGALNLKTPSLPSPVHPIHFATGSPPHLPAPHLVSPSPSLAQKDPHLPQSLSPSLPPLLNRYHPPPTAYTIPAQALILPTPTAMLYTSLLAAAAAFSGLVSAQNDTTGLPSSIGPCCTVDANTIPQAKKESWCQAETNTCPDVCGGPSQVAGDGLKCDPVSRAQPDPRLRRHHAC